jgi:hypothetical protein
MHALCLICSTETHYELSVYWWSKCVECSGLVVLEWIYCPTMARWLVRWSLLGDHWLLMPGIRMYPVVSVVSVIWSNLLLLLQRSLLPGGIIRFYERFCMPLRLGANWGYWPSDSVFDQWGGVHHKLLMFLTWMGSFTCHCHRHQVKGTSVLRLIRRTNLKQWLPILVKNVHVAKGWFSLALASLGVRIF